MTELKRYILLPREGFFNEALSVFDPVAGFDGPFKPFVVTTDLAGNRKVLVLDSIVAQGPKLVEMDDKAAHNINKSPDVYLAPVIRYIRPFYGPLVNRRPSEASKGLSISSYPFEHKQPILQSGQSVTIKVELIKNGINVSAGSGLLVTAFTDYSAGTGDEKVTDGSGEVVMQLSGNTIERLYCEQLWKWGAFRENIAVIPSITLVIDPLDENFTDGVRQYYGQSRFEPKTGVTVGVIDTGVGPHDDLNVIGCGGKFHVVPHQDFLDVIGHGTCVAGLIGSRGLLFPKLRGLAPGVLIRAYKIFKCGTATNLDLMRAIYVATSSHCDILNLSIENGPAGDMALQSAITNAQDNGILVVAAAGNDERKAVNYPAACSGVTAVSAMGCEGTFPVGAIDAASVYRPPNSGNDPKEFIAAFSNVGINGTNISITALGVGVLSTLPGNSFGSCSGTSMAAPVVSGTAACLLSRNPEIYNMPRKLARSRAIEKLLYTNCAISGFDPIYGGNGMPDPAKV